MKMSRTRFVLIFLVSAFAFQFITNSLLGPEVSLFPGNGDFFPGGDTPTGWKSGLSKIIYPVKYILVKPLVFLGQDPDPVPPVMLIAFALYWAVLALALYFVFSKINYRKKG